MFRYLWLLALTLLTGCTSIQYRFCNLVESDSYVLVSVAGCQTMQVSIDYDADTDLSTLRTYRWMPREQARSGDPEGPGGSEIHRFIKVTVDEKLASQGLRQNPDAPDFLVNYDLPSEMQGTLSLTFVHAGSRQILWRGMTDDEAYPARSQYAWEKRVRTALDKLLGQFPPDNNGPPRDDTAETEESG